jgi:hypothetical protein
MNRPPPPDVIPFVARAAAPLARWQLVYMVDGNPIQFFGERWADRDAASCPYPLMPDPRVPGESVTLQLISLATGQVSHPLSPAEVERLKADSRSQYHS